MLGSVDHFASRTHTFTLLEVMAKDGATEADSFALVFDLVDVFKLAARSTGALVTKIVEANVREEELFTITSIHGGRKVAVFEEKGLFAA